MKKLKLTQLPTPVTYYGSFKQNDIYIKRDDLTDVALGGNKARKLEYFLFDALNRNCNCIVTYGSVNSNHCRITAAISSKLGLKTILIMPVAQNVKFNGNYFLCKLFNAEEVWTDLSQVPETIEKTLSNLKRKGYKPYFIQGGGHGNLGTQAYVEAYREIILQSEETYDYIFHASGTGTTQAGLIIGSKLEGKQTNIVGISIARKEQSGKKVILESINEYIEEHSISANISEQDILFTEAYIGSGYGDVYPAVLETIKKVANKSTILLDPVYTGKAFYGMLDYIEKKQIENKNILFIHTGGTPLLFNYAKAFEGM